MSHQSVLEEYSRLTAVDGNRIDWVYNLTKLWGPGLGPHNVVTPMVEIESIFDSIFTPELPKGGAEIHGFPMLHLYKSNRDILDAYYIFIHPYLPILPPPEYLPVYNRPSLDRRTVFMPSTPLGLAFAAILVLIPHPSERDSSREEYVRIRREFAHQFAQSAYEVIQKDQYFRDKPSVDEELFHPKVPYILEKAIALTVLSIYEYAQRGSMEKMVQQAREALKLAMDMSLHESINEDCFSEARQRTWWMTYMIACHAFTVSSKQPTFNVYDPCFVTPYPEKEWKLFIESQQTLLETTMFAHDLDEAIQSRADLSWVPDRVEELDDQISALLFHCRDKLAAYYVPPQQGAFESTTLKIMRSCAEIRLHSARIEIHQLHAFKDIPMQVQLKGHTEAETLPISTFPNDGYRISALRTEKLSTCYWTHNSKFPFSFDTSLRICLSSTLNVVTLLDDLPYLNPTDENSPLHSYSSQGAAKAPRSMPILLCCAIQSCHILLMFCFKLRVLQMQAIGGPTSASKSVLIVARNELHQALRLVSRYIADHSLTFESLQGIRDEVIQAIEQEFARC